MLFLVARALCLAAGLLGAGISLPAAAPHRTVKVAVFPHPPAIFVDEADGVVKGFYVDMLREVASLEHWDLEFVPGTWAEGLERARKGDVDLVTSVGFTPERATFLDYGKEPSFTVWSLLYAHPKADIQSILDLKDRTVAVMRNDANGANFRSLSTQFAIPITFVELGTFVDVMKAVESRRVDAGVTPNTFGYYSESNYRVVRTPVVVNPFPIFFAVGKNTNADLLPPLDRFLAEGHGNPGSRAALIVNRWLNRSNGGLSPWVMRGFFLGLALLALSLGSMVVFRRQVRRATREIRSLNRDLQRELVARRAREERILNVARGVSAGIGEAFFQDLVKFLASAADADMAYIGEVHGDRVQVIAAWMDGALIPPFDFAKGDTPCEEVLKGEICVVTSGLQDRFPRDLYLIGPGFNSYVGTPLRDEANQVSGLMAILRRSELGDPDEVVGLLQIFTVRAMSEMERRSREAALRESEALLAKSQEMAHVGSWVLDRAVNRLTWSDEVFRIFGETPQTYPATYEAFLQAVHPEDRAAVNKSYSDSLQQGKDSYEIEHRVIRKDTAEIRFVFEKCLHVRDESGSVIKSIGMVQDITERKRAEVALKASEENLAITLHSIGDAVIATDTDGLITRMNSTAVRLTGWSLATALGRPLTEVFRIANALTREQSEDPVQKVLAHGEVVDLANHTVLLARDGQEYQIADSAAPIRDAAGKILGVVLVFSDVTEKYRIEEALVRTTDLLKSATEIAKIGAWELNLASMELTWSLGTYRLHELDPLTPIDVTSGIHFYAPEAQPVITAAVQAAIKTGTPYDLELPLVTAKGRAFWARAQCNPVTENGRVTKLVGAFQDISERKQAEAALLESENRWKFAIEGAGDGLWDWNVQTGKAYFSLRYKEMYGYADADIGTTSDEWSKRIHPEDAPGVFAALQPYLEGKPGFAMVEFRMLCKDGSWRWTLGRGMVISRDTEGKPTRMIGTNTDITERKLAEEEKAKLQAQLQQSQKMESLGTLAGGVAHDMNNVLGAILGLASAHIGTQPIDSPLHQALDTICKATERGGKMVKSLLSFARQSPAENSKLDMNAIVREQIALLERTTLAKVRLHLDLERELRPILGDASALTHAFMNLCVNAVDAMPENGTLTLHTRNVDNDWIEVMVEDNGMGMSKEVLEKALEPFFTTKETGKGTGLGLSMVFSTMKAHRGQMAIESELDKGTRVMLRFPACEVAIPQAPAPAVGDAPLSPQGVLKVLLVDDDDLIQSSVQAILEVLGHTAVTAALSGEDALALIEAGFEPDVVILDMNMPGLGGIGTLPRLRTLRPVVPVLLATGRVDQAALTLAAAHPGVTLLSKPFGLKELRKHLETIALG